MTEQVAVAPLPFSVQLAGLNVPVPLGVRVQLTLPAGVIAAPGLVSETVAVQVVGVPARTVLGEQVTSVLVARDGQVCVRHVGVVSKAKLERQIGALL